MGRHACSPIGRRHCCSRLGSKVELEAAANVEKVIEPEEFVVEVFVVVMVNESVVAWLECVELNVMVSELE